METSEDFGETRSIIPALKLRSDETNGQTGSVDYASLPICRLYDRREQQDEELHLLRLAWAIVLRAYTGADRPEFLDLTPPSSSSSSSVSSSRSSSPLYSASSSSSNSLGSSFASIQKLTSCSPDQANSRLTLHEHSSYNDSGWRRRVNTAIAFDFAPRGSPPHSPAHQLPIIVRVSQNGSAWVASLDYNLALLPRDHALQLVDLIRHVQAQLRRDDLTLANISLCSSQTFKQLELWHAPVVDLCPAQFCVHDLILQHCRESPHNQAICAWDGDFTYGELDALSARLSVRLVTRGIGPNRYVGLYLNKSRWTAVAILAVLRAGGAFTFLDTSFPTSRLKNMCDRLEVSLVVTTPDLKGTAAEIHSDFHVMNILSSPSQDDDYNNDNNSIDVTSTAQNILPHLPAYVSWTSGSTGTPKGPVITHQSFISGQQWVMSILGYDSESRVLQFSAHGFDLCYQDYLVPLMAGSCICVPSETSRKGDLRQAFVELDVNFAILTPTVVRLLTPKDVPSLKTLGLCGEALLSSDISTWSSHVNLYNIYGPAECSVVTTIQSYERGLKDENIIGSAGAARCWIVDPLDPERLLPIGAVGELLIEGYHVGRGYAGDVVQTESHFIPPPRWREKFSWPFADTRMYRTGDLVQYVDDGALRYIGRKDLQVKLRGQRLEIREIEQHMQDALPARIQALASAVLLKGDATPCLVGFIHDPEATENQSHQTTSPPDLATPTPEFCALATNLRKHLSQSLPPFMVPPLFVPLTSIPATHTGKTHRTALANLVANYTRHDLNRMYMQDSVQGRHQQRQPRPPSTSNEKILYHLLQKVLKIDGFGMNDNFFSLGGDSLRIMELVRLAWDDHHISLTAKDVVENPVLENLSRTITGAPSPPRRSVEVSPFSLLAGHDAASLDVLLNAAKAQCELSPDDVVEDIYPCTPLQEGLIALSASSPDPMYMMRTLYQLPIGIDMARLRNAWYVTCQRNDVLRTRMVQVSSESLLQVVVDSKVFSEWEATSTLADLHRKSSEWRMALGQALIHFVALDHETDGKWLAVSMHHALYDGWSIPRNLELVEREYHKQPIPDCLPFRNFVHHVQQVRDGAQMQEFWRESLRDYSHVNFPGTASYAGETRYRPVAIKTMRGSAPSMVVREFQVTLSTIVEVAWALTICQYTGQADACYGVTVSGRQTDLPGIDRVLGPTIATIPRRFRFDLSTTIAATLLQFQSQTVGTLPFEQIGLQELASLGPGPSEACRFETHMVIQPPVTQQSTSSMFANADTTEIADSYVVSVEVTLPESAGTPIDILMTYDSDRVAPWLMEQVLNHFLQHFRSIASGTLASANIRNLFQSDLAAENHSAVSRWNAQVPTAVEACVHELVKQRTVDEPHSIAVEAWDGTSTYEALQQSALALAGSFQQQRDVGRGDFVVVILDRSLLAVTTMLAIMYAGGVIVMIDPNVPPLRLQQIVRDTQPKLLVTSPEHASRAADLNLPALTIRRNDLEQLDPRQFEAQPTSPSDTCYVVFTSGSTGKPKGVVVQHRALATAASINGSKFFIGTASRVLHIASYTFDASLAEVFYTLVQGGCVCIPPESSRGNDLEAAMNAYRVTWVTLTPSLARELDPSKLDTLAVVALGGEAVTEHDVNMWAEKVHLTNGYGPAEATIDATIQLNVSLSHGASNIGFGAATVTWIVHPDDPTLLMPPGATGELALEGHVLAREYLNDKVKTAAAFIPFPDWLEHYRQTPGRLYLTGDLVRYSPAGDGSLLYLGRKDNQIKLRGQRIELGEVEQHLKACLPTVKEVTVDVIQPADPGAERTLAAFILFKEVSLPRDATSSPPSLLIPASESSQAHFDDDAQKRLRERLPHAMVPSFFISLRRTPITSTGKIDRQLLRQTVHSMTRKQLSEYNLLRGSVSARPQASYSPEESLVRAAVSAAISRPLEEIEVDDDFFHVGGDSITAMRVVAHIKAAGFTVTVADLFNNPRLAKLATKLKKNVQHGNSDHEVVPFAWYGEGQKEEIIEYCAAQCGIKKEDVEDVYPCTPMQESLFALTLRHQGHYVYHLDLQLPQGVELDTVKAAWQVVFDANSILRTRIVLPSRNKSDPPLQVVVRENIDWFSADDDVEPFIISPGQRLHKATWYWREDRLNLRLFLHHSLYDDQSLQTILEQVEAAYHGEKLPARPFSPFALYTTRISTTAAKDFWTKSLADLNVGDMWPVRHVNRLHGTSTAERQTVRCSIGVSTTSDALKDATLPTVLQSACAIMLAHYNLSQDVVYGITLSGRNAPIDHIAQMTGPTITTVPFRVRMDRDMPIRQLLSEVQAHLIRLIPYEQVGLREIAAMSPDCLLATQFNCHVVIQPSPPPRAVPDGRTFQENDSSPESQPPFSNSPLVLVFQIAADKKAVHLEANFDPTYFEREEVHRFSLQLEHVVAQMLRDSSSKIAKVQMVSPSDLKRIEEQNAVVPTRENVLIHDMIFERASFQPDAEAVCAWDGSLTYGQLRDLSRQLSRYLVSIGIADHPVTAICIPKSRWTVVAVMAVLQTGSACTMLDPSHPPERIRGLVAQVKAAFVLVSSETKPLFEADVRMDNVEVIAIPPNAERSLSAHSRIEMASRNITPDDTAFIMFTSGSTGQPKGIVHQHGGLATSLRDLSKPHNVNRHSRILHFASYAFDGSLSEMLLSLVSGVCLCIPSELDMTSNLAKAIAKYHINWCLMIPAASRLLSPVDVPGLQTIVFAGEYLDISVVERWRAALPHLTIITMYGPAEVGFACTGTEVHATQWTSGLIGSMINGRGWIVDPADPSRLCAQGAVGELVVESASLAQEYLNRPEDTAANFIRSPAWLSKIRGHDRARLYRTGDLCQDRLNGQLRFVSRKDRQIKLNGQRIEPAEIESELKSILGQGVAAIIVEPLAIQGTSRMLLCAFLLATQQNGAHSAAAGGQEETSLFVLPSGNLRQLLRSTKENLSRRLPRYMIPSLFLSLAYVPMTLSGKVDRRLLAKQASELTPSDLHTFSGEEDTGSGRHMPITSAEMRLAKVWAEVLAVSWENIKAHDNFFYLGGDSILAMKLTAALRQVGCNLSVPAIFSNPSLAAMAQLVTTQEAAPPSDMDTAVVEPLSLLPIAARDNAMQIARQQCSVDADEIEDVYPCTPIQEGMIAQSIRNHHAYMSHFRYTLARDIDLEKLRAAWLMTIRAHAVLRTRIIRHQSHLLQIVVKSVIAWEVTDDLDSHRSPLKEHGFQFGQPLLHLTLKRDGTEFELSIHHVLYDAWSLSLVLDDVHQAYRGQISPARAFNHFVHFVRQPAHVQKAQEVWRKHLAGSSSTGMFPQVPRQDAYVPFTNMSIQSSIILPQQSGTSDITLATIIQFAWIVTLSQCCGSKDIIFGHVRSGRTTDLEGVETVAGPTIATIPMRFTLNDDATVLDELHRLQQLVTELSLVEQLGIHNIRRLGESAKNACQFNNLLLIEHAGHQSQQHQGVQPKLLAPVEETRGKTDGNFSAYALEVTCQISQARDSATVVFHYDSRVLESTVAERTLAQFTHIWDQVQRHQTVGLKQLDLLSPSMRSQIWQWNKTLPPAMDTCVHDGIKAQCSRTPQAPAVCAWDGNISYEQLERLSSTIAWYLQHDHNVRAETLVPILSERSKWVAIMILGIIKAGGAFVLLDPSSPEQRLHAICETTRARVVLTSASCASLGAKLVASVVTVADNLLTSLETRYRDIPELQSDATPQSALYSIFTSGTTGRPKGMIVSHSAFHTSGVHQKAPLYLDAQTRTLQLASHMFDVCVADYLWTFLVGGCVCVASASDVQNDLATVINQYQINRVDMTPSLARVLDPEQLPTLKTILLGGEAMTQTDVDKWAGKVNVVNGYGPSEASVCCVLADVEAGSDPRTIGHTYGAVSWIVDEHDHNVLMPIGSVGELLLEGHTLARGYIDHPEKTAAAFIHSSALPWLRDIRPNSRLYKTGDLACYNSDGTLRFMGRKDTQVKIRGQRVELEEIEQHIRSCGDLVRDAVTEVIRPPHADAGQVLVAFVEVVSPKDSSNATKVSPLLSAPSSRFSDTVAVISTRLKDALPIYMVPDVFIPITKMPVSLTGKSDRRRLREACMDLTQEQLNEYRLNRQSGKRSPESGPEKVLQKVVADVLHVPLEDIGMDDSFFSLGGDSISAIALVDRARAHKFHFRVTDVFKTPRLARLADLVLEEPTHLTNGNDSGQHQDQRVHSAAIDPARRSSIIASIPPRLAQHRVEEVMPVTWAAQRYLYQTPEYWILNFEGDVDSVKLERACEMLVRRHAILRSIFLTYDDDGDQIKHAQVVLDGLNKIFSRKSTIQGIANFVDQYRIQDGAMVTPTLGTAITEFTFVTGNKSHSALVVRLSHAQFDGYCLHILWQDLKHLYETEGEIGLPPAASYETHMQEWERAQTTEAFDFWRLLLQDSTIARINNTHLDTDSIPPDQTQSEFVTVSTNVAMGPDCELHNVTLATVVKTAWAILLAYLTHNPNPVFAQASSGRSNGVSTRHIVGMCLNFTPVRGVNIKPQTAISSILSSLHDQHHSTLDHELLDFPDVVARSTSWPAESRFQSLLVHQNIEPDVPFPFGTTTAQVTCSYDWPHPPDEILIESKLNEDGSRLVLTLDTRSEVLTRSNAAHVLDMMARLINAIIRPNSELGTIADLLEAVL